MALNQVGLERLNTATTDKLGERKNKLINGGMTVSQRGTSFTTGDNAEHFSADRWILYVQNSNSRFTVTQSTDTPDGFGNSVKIDCTTADTSLASNEEVQFYQKIEGFNTQDFAKGTSAAKQYTLSFYVKTNKTGTYIVRLLGRDNTTSHVAASYTVSDSNWNRYTVTFPADTTSGRGDNNDNGESLRVVWWLVAGSAVNSGSLQTTWANSSDTGAATGQVNFADSTSNDFFITGCQLEVGSVATDFEHRSLAEELTLCKRYFNNFGATTATGTSATYMLVGGGYARFGSANSIALNRIFYDVEMRANPTITYGRNSTNDDNNVMRWSSAGTNPIVELASTEASNQSGYSITRYNSDAGQTYNDGDFWVHQISKFTANAEL